MLHQSKDEYTATTRISAIHDTKADDVQFVGVRNDGNRQYFPLQLRPNYWPSNQQSSIERRPTSIRWRPLACTTRRCTDDRHQVRFVLDELEVCEAQSPQAICRCLKVLCRMAV